MMNYFYGYDDTEVNEAKNLIKLLDERIHNVLEKLKTINISNDNYMELKLKEKNCEISKKCIMYYYGF